ncbi:MAG TPA: acetate kinase [Burkholderiaceae bacterium]|nr:acetate kinase [Burkholderiaceae bacterium]
MTTPGPLRRHSPAPARAHLLTLNAGSSSIKYALFARDELGAPVFEGQVEGIGRAGGPATHDAAMARVLVELNARQERVVAVGHRIVHGGARLVQPVRIDDAVLAQMSELIPLAPLHQPHNVAGVRASRNAFAGVPQVACFDTAFHVGQPELNRRFALPQALFDAGVRRYGFHGLSYESVFAQLLADDPVRAQGRVVIAHLGNGASMCAMHSGRSVATTMSFSPLDGLPMGTRCGRLDAAVVLHLIRQQGRGVDEVERLLFRESGLLGLSGVSSDLRELEASANPPAAMAIDYFVEHALRELAGMVAALRGIDTLVFTGGIGEHAANVRQRIVDGAAWMGPVDVQVLRTNEEAVIARHTAALV